MLPPTSWVKHRAWTAEPSGTVPAASRTGWRTPRLTLSKWPPGVSEPSSLTPQCLLITVALRAADSGSRGMEMQGSGGMWQALWLLQGKVNPSDFPGEARNVLELLIFKLLATDSKNAKR